MRSAANQKMTVSLHRLLQTRRTLRWTSDAAAYALRLDSHPPPAAWSRRRAPGRSRMKPPLPLSTTPAPLAPNPANPTVEPVVTPATHDRPPQIRATRSCSGRPAARRWCRIVADEAKYATPTYVNGAPSRLAGNLGSENRRCPPNDGGLRMTGRPASSLDISANEKDMHEGRRKQRPLPCAQKNSCGVSRMLVGCGSPMHGRSSRRFRFCLAPADGDASARPSR